MSENPNNWKNPGIKIPYLDITDKPIVEGTRCVEVRIPDDDAYMPVLAGLVALATKWFNWQRDPTHKGADLAKMWQNAYRETDWEGCMTCEDVENCIETDEGVQDALEQNLITNINSSTSVQTALQQQIQQHLGAENPLPQANTNLIQGLVDCDFDALYGMADTLVEWLNQNNLDFFERLVIATTPYARASALSEEIPGYSGATFGELASAVATFLSGTLKTNYEAFYDTAYADALKCEIFCLARDSCSLTVQQLYALFSSRLGIVTPLESFYGGLQVAVFGTWTGSQFADVAMFTQVGSFLFMGGFARLLGINPLQNAIVEGYNDPDEDWTGCDCPDTWCIKIDAANGLDTLFFATGTLGAQALWTGTGWARNDAVATSRITIGIDLGAAYNMSAIRVVNSQAITNGDTNTKNILDYPSFTVLYTEPAAADVTFQFGEFVPVQKFAIDCISDSAPNGAAVPGEIIEVYFYGTGTPPEIGTSCE